MKSRIEWTGMTWHTVDGCMDASPGCANCYAKREVYRLSFSTHPETSIRYRGLTVLRSNGPQWTGEVRQFPAALTVPLQRQKPTTYFVNSRSDTWHRDVSSQYIMAMFGVMAMCPQHTFLMLTKRDDIMADWHDSMLRRRTLDPFGPSSVCSDEARRFGVSNHHRRKVTKECISWPLPNVYHGVSVENVPHGIPRIANLRRVPGRRFLSVEPQLEHLGKLDLQGIHCVIIGGESGPNAREYDVMWARDIIAQCRAAGVKVYLKQVGARPVDSSRAAVHQPCMHESKPALRSTVYKADAPEVEAARIASKDSSLRLAAPMVEHPVFLRDHFRYEHKKGGDPDEWPHDLRDPAFRETPWSTT